MLNIVYVRGPKKKNHNYEFDHLFEQAYEIFKIQSKQEKRSKCTRRKFINYINSFYKLRMNIVNQDYTFTFSLKQKSCISSSKKGRYPIHSYELIVLLKVYVKMNGNPTAYIKVIDNFFTVRRAQINSKNAPQAAIFQKPLVDYYIDSIIKHDRGELIINE